MKGKIARAESSFTRFMKVDDSYARASLKPTDSVTRLYPVPGIAADIIDRTKTERGSIKGIADAIAVDPALTEKMLVMANGPAGRHSDAIKTVQTAIQLAAPTEINDFSVAAAIIVTYSSRHALSLFFLETTTLAAALARNVAGYLGTVSQDKAFLAGLLSEIGALACLKVDSARYPQIWTDCGGLPLRRARLEIAAYGGTTHALGSYLLFQNGLPEEISNAVGTRVDESVKQRDSLPRIIAFCRTVASELVRSNNRSHTKNILDTLHKFGFFFNLDLDTDVCRDLSVHPLLERQSA
ncbi:MAG: HDOD domain-containing protein [Deltaproteobacteria bacterium]|nr:HDOD domain-containing protein [Deltaproteobacteria bacterium]